MMEGAPSADSDLVRFQELPRQVQAPVHTRMFHSWALPDGTLCTEFHRKGKDYLLRFPHLADFEISADGLEVQGWPATAAGSHTLQHLFLNQVLPLALSRQGKLVLHASAVALGEGCVAFMGRSGRGKSTLAGSFATTGSHLLSDDGLQLAWQGSRLVARPSHPSIRLWQDSQAALLTAGNVLAPSLDYTTKARILAGTDISFSGKAAPLMAVYLLGPGEAAKPTIGPRAHAAALLDLVRHSFLLDIDEQEMLASHFDDISRIANLPLHYHLDYPRRYEDLALVRQAILQHNSAVSH